MARKEEDYREAAKIAGDAAKTLITIAVAAAGVAVAYFQFARGQGTLSRNAELLIFLALLLFVVSMISGMVVISRIYKRGEGRIDANSEPHWTTKHVANPINAQSLLGLLGIIAFAGAVFVNPGPPSKHWSVDAPNLGLISALSGNVIQIYGTWDELYVKDENSNWMRLDKVPPGERRVIELRQK